MVKHIFPPGYAHIPNYVHTHIQLAGYIYGSAIVEYCSKLIGTIYNVTLNTHNMYCIKYSTYYVIIAMYIAAHVYMVMCYAFKACTYIILFVA